jgi:ankyrin repeat protein
LQVEHLCQISKAKKDQLIEEALETLPDGLDDTYFRLVKRIIGQSPYMRELALNCLIWTLYAKQPLETKALQGALAIARDSKGEKDTETDQVDVILEACCGLFEESRSVIRPIHFSVQEFFAKRAHGSAYGDNLGFAANPTSAYVELSRVCLISLQFAPPNLLSVHSKYPFSAHAAEFFDHYLFESGCPENVLPLVDNILSRDGGFLSSLYQFRRRRVHLEQSGSYKHIDTESFPLSASAIIYATQLYEIPSIRMHWAGSLPPENALHHASFAGLLSAVARLLEQGCDINERDSDGVAAIHYASECGYDKIVKLLLDKGADVTAQGGRYGDALQAASAKGNNKSVELLLDKGADVNAQGGYYGNALQAASAEGHVKIVELLLDKGADVTAQGGRYGDALQAASAKGNNKIVELLLDKGADVNAQGGYYGNALQAASAKGNNKIVELLLDKGANVNAQGGYYGNALLAASIRGYVKIVELLLDKGANVNAQDEHYSNGLQAALAEGHVKIVELLLDKGADVNAQGGYYGNALQAASAKGNNKIVELLLDKGADVNAQGGYYGNALQAALVKGDKMVVRLLRNKGAFT